MTDVHAEGDEPAIGSRHYRAFVGPPSKYDLVAAMQFNLLTTLGLREHHKLLDVGCGSLRAGRLFIPYLRPGHYFGVEPESWLVEEGIERELGRAILDVKQPRFVHFSDFSFGKLEARFDFVLAQSIFSHASREQVERCMAGVAEVTGEESLFCFTYVKGDSDYTDPAWLYPACVTYRPETVASSAAAAGLFAVEIDYRHPNGQTWVVAAKSRERIRELPLPLRAEGDPGSRQGGSGPGRRPRALLQQVGRWGRRWIGA